MIMSASVAGTGKLGSRSGGVYIVIMKTSSARMLLFLAQTTAIDVSFLLYNPIYLFKQ